MQRSLDVRFKHFLASYPGVENIDEIIPPDAFDGKKRADYLLANRKIILELKLLKTDTSPKVQKEIDKHQHRKDFPLVFGEVPLQEILRRLPDGEKINQRIFQSITRSVEGAVRSAEEQIRDTKKIFRLDDSIGFLVLLNESVDVLAPEVVSYRTSQLLCRKREAKSPPLPLHFVWFLSETHTTKLRDGKNAHLSLLLEGPLGGSASWFGEYFNRLQEGWARFKAAPLVHSDTKRIAELVFRPTKEKREDT